MSMQPRPIELSKLEDYPYVELIGIVSSNEDPSQCGRLKTTIVGFNDNVTEDNKQWVTWFNGSNINALDVPLINTPVYVICTNGLMRWRHIDFVDSNALKVFVTANDYLDSSVLTYKNLNDFNDKGHLFVGWTKKEGFRIVKNNAMVQLRQDDSVLVTDGKIDVHVNDGHISLGSENQSDEPATLGDTNVEALEHLNSTIKELTADMNKNLKLFAAVAKTSPYTRHLQVPLKAYAASVTKLIDTLYARNSKHFPTTRSTKVSLD